MLITVGQFYICFYLYIHLYNKVTLNPTCMRRNQPRGYVDFRFWVVWPIAWFDYFTLEIVRREASKVWTRYNGGKPSSYSTMHASIHENEMWNDILSARSSSHCHLRKVVYLRCNCLPRLVSTGSDPHQLGWACTTTNGRSCLPTTYSYVRSTVIKRTEFDQWLHVILTCYGDTCIFKHTIRDCYIHVYIYISNILTSSEASFLRCAAHFSTSSLAPLRVTISFLSPGSGKATWIPLKRSRISRIFSPFVPMICLWKRCSIMTSLERSFS